MLRESGSVVLVRIVPLVECSSTLSDDSCNPSVRSLKLFPMRKMLPPERKGFLGSHSIDGQLPCAEI